jgi:hypothetical protein
MTSGPDPEILDPIDVVFLVGKESQAIKSEVMKLATIRAL